VALGSLDPDVRDHPVEQRADLVDRATRRVWVHHDHGVVASLSGAAGEPQDRRRGVGGGAHGVRGTSERVVGHGIAESHGGAVGERGFEGLEVRDGLKGPDEGEIEEVQVSEEL
jgi:hypothetical protein